MILAQYGTTIQFCSKLSNGFDSQNYYDINKQQVPMSFQINKKAIKK